MGIESQIDLKETKKTSALISRYAGIRVPRNKAIVGQNAFKRLLLVLHYQLARLYR
jgi:isopropylmalate/homocitrate/citramalate synthase